MYINIYGGRERQREREREMVGQSSKIPAFEHDKVPLQSTHNQRMIYLHLQKETPFQTSTAWSGVMTISSGFALVHGNCSAYRHCQGSCDDSWTFQPSPCATQIGVKIVNFHTNKLVKILGLGPWGLCGQVAWDWPNMCEKSGNPKAVIPNLLEYSLRILTICLGGSDWWARPQIVGTLHGVKP